MRINIKVKLKSSKQKVRKVSKNNYIVSLKKPAENNKANIELIKLWKKHFNQNIKIIKGVKSRDKVIEV